jgi:NADPH2:quinone reductase
MKAMLLHELTGPAALRLEEVPNRVPGPGEVAIDVRAIGVNFFDILICEGKYQTRPELPFAPGAEVAGLVSEVGEGVDLKPGTRVLALGTWGGYADRVVRDRSVVFAIPDSMSFDDAAAFGIVYQTSYLGLVGRANLRRGETLLVHAAAGGVGLAAVQIGKALGARVIGTAGSAEKLALVRKYGAEALDYRAPGWDVRVKEMTGGRGADVIYDPVGGDTFKLSTKCIAFEGRILIVGFTSGTIPSLEMNRVLLKNMSVVGVFWGDHVRRDPQSAHDMMRSLFAMYDRGQLEPHVSEVLPLTDAPRVLAAMAERKTSGKVVLRP